MGSTWSVRDKVNKVSGSEVGTFMFGDSKFGGISAIIYCSQNILNSPKDPKLMGDNFTIIHNPFAINPLPHTFFTFGDTWILKGDQLKKIKI